MATVPAPPNQTISDGLQQKNDILQKGGVHIDYKHSAFVEFVKYMTGPAVIQAVNKTLFAPLERMKIIYQAQNSLYINEKAKFQSFFSFVSRVPKEQGFSALWRGNFANIMYIIPRTIAQFAFLENINSAFFPDGEKNITEQSYLGRKFGAALASGFCTLAISYPFDVVKTKLSLEFAKNKYDKQFTGILGAIGETKTKNGYGGLYRGFWLSNLINAPYFLVLFTSFQAFKQLDEGQLQSCSEVFTYLAPSSIAGLLATIAVYPLDTIKQKFN